jgi:hypothetical protein
LIRVLGQVTADKGGELRSHAVVHRSGIPSLFVDDTINDRGNRVSRERPLSGEQLEQDDRQGEQVAASVDLLAADLLRRHVARRAQQRAIVGELRLGRLGQAEVHDLDLGAANVDQVGRLDVAMHDTGVVRVFQGFGDAGDHVHDVGDR